MLTMAVPAYTQAVSSSVRGDVVSSGGSTVSNATVEIIDTRTNATSRQAATNGSFNASGLDVGGPYTIRVAAPGYKTREIQGLFLVLGEPLRVRIELDAETASAEKVTVVGQRNRKLDERGVGASYSEKNIRDLPSVSRDVKDIVSQYPLAFQDAGTVIGGVAQNPLSIAGQNPRCNSFTVDGLPQNDSFGLNNNGYPTARGPLPNDWVKQAQIAAAPYDTEYNDFCGGIVNVVTRSGENEVHGSAYYYYKDQDLIGHSVGSSTFVKPTFTEENFGATFSGPIIKNQLFFFAAYDRILRNTPVSIGPGEGSAATFATTVPGITQAEVDQVIQISKDVYNFDPLSLRNQFGEDNRRWIGKLTWQINDDHRAQFTYSSADGGTLSTNASSSSSLPILGLPSDWYLDAEKIQNYSGQVFSNWTDAFSTQLSIGRVKVHADQAPLAGADFAQVYVRTNGVDNVYGNGDDGYIVIGPDQFRQFNVLDYRFDIAKLTGTYEIDNHVVKGGYERKMLDIFNGFVQGSDGIYRFDSIADFEAGIVASTLDTRLREGRGREPIRYANAPDNNEATASATWGYDIDSLYAQDDWDITPNLSVMLGLRYDRFSSKGTIEENPGFVAAYGFSNTTDLDGLDVLLPRGSFSYRIDADTENDPSFVFRGGFGRYSGGSPNVWVSNSYSNNGINYVETQGTPTDLGVDPGFLGQAPVDFDLYNVPAVLQTLLTGLSGDGPVNALAPNFSLPSTWRASLAFDTFWDDWALSAEFMHLTPKDQLVWTDLRTIATADRTAADNRVIYTTIATRPSGNDLLLSNVDGGSADFIMLNAAKSWDGTALGSFDLGLGYVHSDVQDIGYGTSSTASSNFVNRAYLNVNEPLVARSDYEREHRMTLKSSWAYRFFGNNETRVNMFAQRMSGQPYSYVFKNNPYGGNGASFASLLYVPKTDATGNVTLTSDPNVTYAAGFGIVEFNQFLKDSGLIDYAGSVAPRNEFFADWSTRIDSSIEQDVEVFDGNRMVFHLGIQNLGNLLNKDWGQFTSPAFFPSQGVVNGDATGASCAALGQYCFSSFTTSDRPGSRVSTGYPASVWQIEAGVRFEF